MFLKTLFRPHESITDRQHQAGLRALKFQTIAASGADGLASGGFLAAFALILGASNVHIGIMTAIPFIMQPIQIAAVVVVERLRARKIVAVPSYLVSYVAWVPVAMIPFLLDVPNPGAVTLLLFFIAIRGVGIAFVNTSWTSWLRDMVPAGEMGGFFAQRLRVSTLAAAVTALVAAVYIDWWKGAVPESEVIFGYSYAILLGSILLGFGSVGMMARIPEPLMARPEGARPPILRTLAAPLRDRNYLQLIKFLFASNLVAYLAVPFFAVYMLTRLELSLSLVVGLGVLSQIANVLFLRVWGAFVDRYASKVILSICSSLYFLVILAWTFTTMPDKHALTIPLLVILHALLGIASAGINVSTTTIRMKLAPQAQATAFLMAASLAANLGAGIGPLIGGAFIDFFSVRHLEVAIEWVDPTRSIDFPAIFLTGYDFLFAIAFVLGLFTLGILGRVREEGEVQNEVVMNQLMAQTRENLRSLNIVPGLGSAAQFPITGLRYLPRVPGLDVAAGVTAYQLASSTRQAIETIADTNATARQIQSRVNRAVSGASLEAVDATRHGVELAFGATEGAVRAAADVGADAGMVIQASISGSLEAVANAGASPLDAVRGAIYGAVHSASSTGLRADSVLADSFEAVRGAASRLGLTEKEAATHAVQAAVEASENVAVESRAEIREAVLQELSKNAE